jgi:hypothetical protein
MVNKIDLSKATKVSLKKALKDITPFKWSEAVICGKELVIISKPKTENR